MLEGCFPPCSGVRQKMRAEKLRKVAGKYIYKRVFVYICNWKWSITRSNWVNVGFEKKYSKNILSRVMAYMGRRAVKNCRKWPEYIYINAIINIYEKRIKIVQLYVLSIFL